MALIRTDYGLIYNTDGSLCATLLPEGGVAVTEGTENLVTNPKRSSVGNNDHQKVEDTGETYLGCKIFKTTKITSSTPGNQLCAISIADGETYTASIYQKCLFNAGEDFAGRLTFYNTATSQVLAQVQTREVNKWERLKITYTNNTGATLNDVRVFYYPAKTQGSITLTAAPQVEKKPFDTPFVEGTRPAGILSYPELAKQFNQREFTFAAWWRPYEKIPSGQDERLFHTDTGSGAPGNFIGMRRLAGTQNLRLVFPDAAGTGAQGFTYEPPSYEANLWHFVAVVLDVPNMKVRVHLNGEFQEFTLAETPAMLDLQRFFLGCNGTIGQLNGELKNVQIINEALPVEVINNFLNPAN